MAAYTLEHSCSGYSLAYRSILVTIICYVIHHPPLDMGSDKQHSPLRTTKFTSHCNLVDPHSAMIHARAMNLTDI